MCHRILSLGLVAVVDISIEQTRRALGIMDKHTMRRLQHRTDGSRLLATGKSWDGKRSSLGQSSIRISVLRIMMLSITPWLEVKDFIHLPHGMQTDRGPWQTSVLWGRCYI